MTAKRQSAKSKAREAEGGRPLTKLELRRRLNRMVKPNSDEPGEAEAEALEIARLRFVERRAPVYIEIDGEGPDASIASPHSEKYLHIIRLMDGMGSGSYDFTMQAIGRLDCVTRPAGAPRHANGDPDCLNAALAFVEAIRPENEIETALAIQMAGTHELSLDMLGRCKHTERTDHMQLYGNLAVKLQRTFTAQLEALGRLRGKGQQTVRVEHVTVESGAQAIVGDVHHHPGGRGALAKSKGQSHAQVENRSADASLATLRSPHQEREAVPRHGDEERTMPDARRDEPGGAEGK